MMRIRFEDTTTLPVTVEADVRLGRPAPACSNPSSPAFADSGDPPEVELVSLRLGSFDIPIALLSDEDRDDLERAALRAAEVEAARGPDE